MREALIAHLPALRRYAYGLAGARADAEDLLQATVLRALEAAPGWRRENLRAWLYTIMTNLYRNGLRANARGPGLEAIGEADHVAAPLANPDPLLRSRLNTALATLNPEMRAVLMLVVLEGCSYAEVAQIAGVPVGTVMSRLSRARTQLSGLLQDEAVVYLNRGEKRP
ncbi:RNA polymerase sigma factor [Pelagibacterium limicola]|uniref:RNA polymerase sigma factor n=1 Tax=Pelagibacterium limicola TaxID=2791022 RepID=UPI0018AF7BCF|nr:sigma-70 family RNA polymerase sigma factor [Pelagibacterium limicola]